MYIIQIQQFNPTTSLPDFLLNFIDSIIKIDKFGILRFIYLHYSIDQLITQSLLIDGTIWLYLDPYQDQNIVMPIIDTEQQNLLQKKTNDINTILSLQPLTIQKYNQLKLFPNKYLEQFISKQSLLLISKQSITNIDQIRLKCQANIYFDPQNLINDLKKIIAWNQIYRTQSLQSFKYLSNLWNNIVQIILKKSLHRKFYQNKNNDFCKLLKCQPTYKMDVKNWPIIPTQFRQYIQLTDYQPTPKNRTDVINKRLKSLKVPIQCPQNCVCTMDQNQTQRQFCKYSLLNGWETQCPNRVKRMQCNHKSEQRMKKCRNAEIKKCQRKKCKEIAGQQGQYDIQQFMAWGIDLYTRNIIQQTLPQIDINFLEKSQNSQSKNQFIQHVFLTAINFNQKQGYCFQKACQFILKNSPNLEQKQINSNILDKYQQFYWKFPQKQEKNNKMFTYKDRLYTEALLNNYNMCPDKSAYRIHTKGKGAKCINKHGIKQGRFIVQYYGQLYQPWRWYEKEDYIKQLLKKKNMKNIVPQFYNIYLEKHKDQPNGYDIMVVDPIKKGNFSSRFSHSCNPNCGTVITVSDGKYHIGMYSFRDIQYGEELSFDYCSFTQSSYQHTHSICLCGTKKCRGNYLQLANTKSSQTLQKMNCFHRRNSLILHSLDPLTPQDKILMQKHNIKSNTLEDCPQWMSKWVALVLKFMQQQCQIYKTYLIQKWKENYPWDQSAPQQIKQKNLLLYSQTSKNQLFELRFQNLFTTLDKLKYYVNTINDKQPPLSYLSNKDLIQILIIKDKSVLKEIQQVLINKTLTKQSFILKEFASQINKCQDQKIKLLLFRLCCLCISHLVLGIAPKKNFTHTVFADVVYFYAFTHTYFTSHQYKIFHSEPISVCIHEVIGVKQNQSKLSTHQKKYSAQFVWGQLSSWFKQTIVNPQASLSQDRRGTLSFPTIDSTISSQFPFNENRSIFHKNIKERPGTSWPTATKCNLSFKNHYKCYGTISFENYHSRQILKQLPKDNLLESVLDVINCRFSQKLALFKKVEYLLENIPQDSHIYSIIDKLKIDRDLALPAWITQTLQEGQRPRKRRKVLSDQ